MFFLQIQFLVAEGDATPILLQKKIKKPKKSKSFAKSWRSQPQNTRRGQGGDTRVYIVIYNDLKRWEGFDRFS